MRAIEHMTVLGLALLLTSMVFVDDPVAKDDAAKDEPKTDVVEEPKTGEVEEPKARSTWEYLADKYDADEDGKITPEEYGRDETHFKRLDVDSDGVIAKAEIEERDRASRDSRGGRGGGRSGGARGGRGGRGEGGRRGPRGEGEERPNRGVAPLEGSEAPDFELLVLSEKKSAKEEGEEKDTEAKEAEEVKEQDASKGEGEAKEEEKEKKLKLSSFKEKERPVALIFGSYT